MTCNTSQTLTQDSGGHMRGKIKEECANPIKMKCCWHFWRKRYCLAIGWRRIFWDRRWCFNCCCSSKVPGWSNKNDSTREVLKGFLEALHG